MSSNATKRIKLYEQQSGLCFWCGKKMLLPDDERVTNDLYPSIDHVVPKGADGKSEGNIVIACVACNYLRAKYNTGMWIKEMKNMKDTLDKQAIVIRNLKEVIVVKEKDRKRAYDALVSHLETCKPKEGLWKRIFLKPKKK